MRDLEADLATCNAATPGPWKCLDDTPVDTEWASIFPQDLDFVMNAREGWPHAIERAIKAEAENALLRKVAEAVADLYSDWMEYGYMDSITSRSLITVFETWKALAELDEEVSDE